MGVLNNNEGFWREMECLWFGDTDGTFFDFDTVSKNRKIQYPMLPDDIAAKLTDTKKVRILPKQNGEKRILSVDLALMASTVFWLSTRRISIELSLLRRSSWRWKMRWLMSNGSVSH